eukprot:m.239622 g.239622  ORF g.239622 m.239622 type:complete len:87 (+) comp13952_c0_seq1:133-393(+)
MKQNNCTYSWLRQLCSSLLVALEVRFESSVRSCSLLCGLNNNAAALDNLTSLTILIQLAQTSPLAQLLLVINSDERSLGLGAKGLN